MEEVKRKPGRPKKQIQTLENKIIKKTQQSRNGVYRDYISQSNSEQKYYLELTKKSEAFKSCSPRQRYFVINYVICNGNASKAAVMSGCTSKYYAVQAAKWMKQEEVQNAIHDFWEIVFGDKINRIERMLIDAYYRRAFTNRFKYFNTDGTLKAGITEESLGEDHIIIDSIETKYYGKDADRAVVVYNLANRDNAFKQLQSMLGLDVKKIDVKTDNTTQTTGVLEVPGIINAEKWEDMNE